MPAWQLVAAGYAAQQLLFSCHCHRRVWGLCPGHSVPHSVPKPPARCSTCPRTCLACAPHTPASLPLPRGHPLPDGRAVQVCRLLGVDSLASLGLEWRRMPYLAALTRRETRVRATIAAYLSTRCATPHIPTTAWLPVRGQVHPLHKRHPEKTGVVVLGLERSHVSVTATSALCRVATYESSIVDL